MVVRREHADLFGLEDLQVRQARNEGGVKCAEEAGENGETARKRDASKHARLGSLQVRAEDLAGDAGTLDLGLLACALMAAAQKEADGDEACKQGRAALAHEGQRDARERDEAHDAARDEERLQGDGGGEAHRHEGGEIGACTGRRE